MNEPMVKLAGLYEKTSQRGIHKTGRNLGRSTGRTGMSRLEESLLLQIKGAKLPQPAREYRFAPPRRWRFDLYWPAQRVACEVEGGIWTSGRHTRGKGFENDAEKYNVATLEGWRLLRVTGNMIGDGRAIAMIERALQTALIIS